MTTEQELEFFNLWLQRDGYISLCHTGPGLKRGEVVRAVSAAAGIFPYPLVVIGNSSEEEYQRQTTEARGVAGSVPKGRFYRVTAE